MFNLDENSRYFLCTMSVNGNMGINGLITAIRSHTPLSPTSGDVFVFFSKNRKTVKILKWDKEGFLLYQKRLEGGTFQMPIYSTTQTCVEMPWDTFYFILRGITFDKFRLYTRPLKRNVRTALYM